MSNAVNNVNIDDGTKVLSRLAGGDRAFTYPAFSAANAALTGRPTLFFRVQKNGTAGTGTIDVSDMLLYYPTTV